jgi:rhodanese-related sulfurtransferase
MAAIDDVLAVARERIRSIPPDAAAELRDAGALFVDTRPEAQRRRFGAIPGAILIERTVLEWRLDPTSAHRHEAVGDADQAIVVFCQEGFSSILAVSSLVDLGLTRVHDLAGGFQAWAAACLPTVPAAESVDAGS